jgi:hypothetical protein
LAPLAEGNAAVDAPAKGGVQHVAETVRELLASAKALSDRTFRYQNQLWYSMQMQ